MLKVSLLFVLTFSLFATTQTANAGWNEWHAFWNRAHVDKLRTSCWPQPFQKADREVVCRTLSIQLAKGWQRQNTLSHVYFDQDTHELNVAGRRKLAAIMSGTPYSANNTIYVVRSLNPEAQERRVTSIHEASLQIFNTQPNVVSTAIEPRTWSAEYIDAVNRAIEESLPTPRLPEFTSSTSQ